MCFIKYIIKRKRMMPPNINIKRIVFVFVGTGGLGGTYGIGGRAGSTRLSSLGTAINARTATKLNRNPRKNQPAESLFFSFAMNAQKPPKTKACTKRIAQNVSMKSSPS